MTIHPHHEHGNSAETEDDLDDALDTIQRLVTHPAAGRHRPGPVAVRAGWPFGGPIGQRPAAVPLYVAAMRKRSAILAMLVAAAGGLFATTLVSGGTAYAATGPLHLAASTPASLTASKQVTITCPQWWHLTSAGGTTTAPDGYQVLVSWTHADFQTAIIRASAEPNHAPTTNWSMTGRVICTPLNSLTQVVATDGPSPSAIATATCPAGREVAGIHVEQLGTKPVVAGARPLTDRTGGTGHVVSRILNENVAARTTINCAAPFPNAVVVTNASAMNSDTHHRAHVECPPGRYVTTSGYLILKARGQALLTGLDLGQSTVSGTARESAAGWNMAWSFTVYAVCIQPITGSTPPGGPA